MSKATSKSKVSEKPNLINKPLQMGSFQVKVNGTFLHVTKIPCKVCYFDVCGLCYYGDSCTKTHYAEYVLPDEIDPANQAKIEKLDYIGSRDSLQKEGFQIIYLNKKEETVTVMSTLSKEHEDPFGKLFGNSIGIIQSEQPKPQELSIKPEFPSLSLTVTSNFGKSKSKKSKKLSAEVKPAAEVKPVAEVKSVAEVETAAEVKPAVEVETEVSGGGTNSKMKMDDESGRSKEETPVQKFKRLHREKQEKQNELSKICEEEKRLKEQSKSQSPKEQSTKKADPEEQPSFEISPSQDSTEQVNLHVLSNQPIFPAVGSQTLAEKKEIEKLKEEFEFFKLFLATKGITKAK